MELEILSAREYNVKLKATIQASGKLGFTAPTAKFMNFTPEGGIKFGRDSNGQLYLIYCPSCDEDTFKLYVSNGYYSVNTKVLFDNLGYDYVNQSIAFDLIRVPDEEQEIYKMMQRKSKNKNEDQ